MFGFEDTELFSCCVCRQSFATELPEPGAPDLRPVSLPCGHTICARCGVEVRTVPAALHAPPLQSPASCTRREPLARNTEAAAPRMLLWRSCMCACGTCCLIN